MEGTTGFLTGLSSTQSGNRPYEDFVKNVVKFLHTPLGSRVADATMPARAVEPPQMPVFRLPPALAAEIRGRRNRGSDMILATQTAGSSLAGYAPVAALLLLLVFLAAVILLLTHAIPKYKRTGPVKDSTYESGMETIGDARRRFHIPFYLVVMLFLLFDVELVFMYPWAIVTYHAVASGAAPAAAAGSSGALATFLIGEMALFVGILLVGYVYAWRKRIFLG